jgi:hypothetical protein
MELFIQGGSSNGKVQEKLERKDFHWNVDEAVATSRQVYSSLEEIQVKGLKTSDRLVVRTVDYTFRDQTGFLPLWAGIPDEAQAYSQARSLLFDPQHFWFPAGFSSMDLSSDPGTGPEDLQVYFPWNQIIAEGLLAYGMRTEAAQLVSRLMETAIQNLKQQGAFFNSYRAVNGEGCGERNSLHGLAPLGLFMKTLGVEILSANCVHLEGHNPFPWPVTITYRGLVIIRHADHTDISFPNGKTTLVLDPAACLVSNP